MKKVVINRDFGGFGLSKDAFRLYGKKAGLNLVEDEPDRFGFVHFYHDQIHDDNYFSDYDIPRDCPHLVSTIEELGEKAFGRYAKLRVVEIPEDVEFTIEEYDGREWVAEVHRTWY